jgi:hypothetical protein
MPDTTSLAAPASPLAALFGSAASVAPAVSSGGRPGAGTTEANGGFSAVMAAQTGSATPDAAPEPSSAPLFGPFRTQAPLDGAPLSCCPPRWC